MKKQKIFSSFSRSGDTRVSSADLFLEWSGNKTLQHHVSISIGVSVECTYFALSIDFSCLCDHEYEHHPQNVLSSF